jgi:hypothetical protein
LAVASLGVFCAGGKVVGEDVAAALSRLTLSEGEMARLARRLKSSSRASPHAASGAGKRTSASN